MAGKNCAKTESIVVLIVGLLLLSGDLGYWDWGIAWSTAAFILYGLFGLMKAK